jgi:lysozyme
MRFPRTLPIRFVFAAALALASAGVATRVAADARRSVRGVDVSHWQGSIDWTAVRGDGITFAFIKASEGGDLVDPQFSRNWPAARRAGVIRGAYHFYRPGTSAAAQARHFLRTVRLGEADLPPVLDVETIGSQTPAQVRRGIRTWLRIVEAETGKRPIVYINPRVAGRLDGELGRHALWIAHYRPSQPPIPDNWTRWTFWQYTSAGRVDGIRRRVDLNRYRGTRAELREFVSSQGHRRH